MHDTTLHFGLREIAKGQVKDPSTTVGEQIEFLLRTGEQGPGTDSLRQALATTGSLIEINADGQVQTATSEMPLRELLPAKGALEITVSTPHVGG